MKSIAMPVFARPEYLAQTLEALAAADGIGEYVLHVSAEADADMEVISLIAQWSACPVVVAVQSEHLGCNVNTRKAIDQAFDGPAEWVLLIEDDVVVAPDALVWTEWSTQHWDSTVIGSHSLTIGGLLVTSDAVLSPKFSSWGAAWPRGQWATLREVWPDDDSLEMPSWDIVLNDATKDGLWVTPLGSKVKNVGRENGVHQQNGAPWLFDDRLAKKDGPYRLLPGLADE